MSAELAGQSARAFLRFLPNSDLEGDNKRGSEHAPGASRATASLPQVCEDFEVLRPGVFTVSRFMELSEFVRKTKPELCRRRTWTHGHLREKKKTDGKVEVLEGDSSRLFCVTGNHNKWQPVYTADAISDYKRLYISSVPERHDQNESHNNLRSTLSHFVCCSMSVMLPYKNFFGLLVPTKHRIFI
ncbi:Myosin-7 [Clarias magur]|uniref:Myosin-7 n=1 Tax=Clarias magur TaxID=1594786 RepID=A0A8J4URH9_CLAMG|nr:Myosin-7 [Clarias magur]